MSTIRNELSVLGEGLVATLDVFAQGGSKLPSTKKVIRDVATTNLSIHVISSRVLDFMYKLMYQWASE